MIHTLNLYDSKNYNLPYYGWIKVCVTCNKPTSSFIIENHRFNKYKIYICHECKKDIKNILQIKKNLDYLVVKSYDYRRN